MTNCHLTLAMHDLAHYFADLARRHSAVPTTATKIEALSYDKWLGSHLARCERCNRHYSEEAARITTNMKRRVSRAS